jgi:hypothetical protein
MTKLSFIQTLIFAYTIGSFGVSVLNNSKNKPKIVRIEVKKATQST